ncbi:MAG: TorD/DmsD family molecular chaperone [Geminicoccaceae bacterium]
MASTTRQSSEALPEEEQLRAVQYRLLARLLASAPDESVLRLASGLTGDDSPLGAALGNLGRVATRTTPAAVSDEYADLFIGVGRGELLPYASYYLTGFLNEKPLARLRQDMARLGIARAEEVKEPEDHIAAICEMMAGLIEGSFDVAADLETQRAFYERHLAPWAERFFADLEAARSAAFYAPVGSVGRAFMEIERAAFAMSE